MQILLGGLWGYILGAVAWFAACHFAAHYQTQAHRPRWTEPTPSPHEAHGTTSPLRAITQGGMALLGAYVCWRAPSTGEVVAALLVTPVLVVITLVDLEVRRIPNALSLTLLLWTLVQVLWLRRPTLTASALGMLVGGALFLIIALLERGAMGAGDVKLAAALGALLAYPLILHALFWGVLAAAGAALVLIVTRRAKRKDTMAYGPYLALGGWVVWMGSLGLWS